MRKIAEAFLAEQIAGSRHRDDPAADQLARDRRITEGRATIREDLRNRKGAEGAESMLQRVERFVKSDPQLQEVLNTGGIGSRRDVFEELEGHVFTNGIV